MSSTWARWIQNYSRYKSLKGWKIKSNFKNTLWVARAKLWAGMQDERFEHLIMWITPNMNTVCPPELWPRNREPSNPVPQAERFSEEPPELHPGPAEGWTLWWTSFQEATQWFPYLGGGSDWCSQEPASLARQVGTTPHKINLGNLLDNICKCHEVKIITDIKIYELENILCALFG